MESLGTLSEMKLKDILPVLFKNVKVMEDKE